jgi:hypothetical protein
MNNREKKLIFILFGAAFLIVNVFLFTSYNTAMKKKENQLKQGTKELKKMNKELDAWASQEDDVNWLVDNPPVVGIHSQVRSDLVSVVQRSAQKYRVTPKKAPIPQPENTEEFGAYRSARVKVLGNAMDRELYLWLTDLQDPQKGRSITSLSISPQRDDPTRIDCELEVTQWFTPEIEEEAVTTN